MHAFEAELVPSLDNLVRHVLRRSAKANVAPAVVEAVTISVIDLHPWSSPEQLPVHEDASAMFASCGVSVTAASGLSCPTKSSDRLNVGEVDYGHEAPGQRNLGMTIEYRNL
jgi:hypothetical protein